MKNLVTIVKLLLFWFFSYNLLAWSFKIKLQLNIDQLKWKISRQFATLLSCEQITENWCIRSSKNSSKLASKTKNFNDQPTKFEEHKIQSSDNGSG